MPDPWVTWDAYVIACKQTHHVPSERRQWIEIAFGQPIQTIRVDLSLAHWQAMYHRFTDTSTTKPDFRLELHALLEGDDGDTRR